jgi:TRAP-type C4-dicarboxylate transport system substrate-binding protein
MNRADWLEEILKPGGWARISVAKAAVFGDIPSDNSTARHEAEPEDTIAKNRTRHWTRRAVLAGAAAAGSAIIVRPTLAADYEFSQYHNQAAGGTLHKNLTAMWEAVRLETNGRVETTVYAENNKLPGGDPDALKLLISGEIQFFTLMGGIIGTVVPVAEAQQLPFAFKTAAEAHKAIDGPLGQYVGQEMAAKGMHLFPVAGFDNGMRHASAEELPPGKH